MKIITNGNKSGYNESCREKRKIYNRARKTDLSNEDIKTACKVYTKDLRRAANEKEDFEPHVGL